MSLNRSYGINRFSLLFSGQVKWFVVRFNKTVRHQQLVQALTYTRLKPHDSYVVGANPTQEKANVAHFKRVIIINSKTTLRTQTRLHLYAMEAASIFSPSVATPISNTPPVNRITNYSKSKVEFACCNRGRCCYNLIGNRGLAAPSAASNDVSSVADPVTAEVTWQIIVGATGMYYISVKLKNKKIYNFSSL